MDSQSSQSRPNNMTVPHPRAPIRSTTFDHEGWIKAQQQRQRSDLQPVTEGSLVVEEAVCPPPPRPSSPSILLSHSRWQTDIVTFCSHIARDPLLRRARVTEIQNRKSRKLPYLQEYILLFFAVGQRRFVARIDYAGWCRPGAKNPELLLGQAPASRQRVTVYQAESGEDAPTPWFEDDGRRGSELVAALLAWTDLGASGMTVVSHHLSTVRDAYSGEGPSLHDVCRLVEAVVLEAPSSYFKTASSYITSRSALLVIHNCFPHDFACSLGEERELVAASALEEPAWATLIRWYLPFASLALVIYAIAVVAIHIWVAHLLTSNEGTRDRVDVLEAADKCIRDPTRCSPPSAAEAAWKDAFRLTLHVILDLPFPVGLLHTWLTSIEMDMGGLVKRISTRFLNEDAGLSDTTTVVKTWFGTFSRPWFHFVVGSCLGSFLGLALFLGILLGHGAIVLLLLVICIGLTVNYMLPSLDDGASEQDSDDDGLPLIDCESSGRESQSESELFPSVAGPSSSR